MAATSGSLSPCAGSAGAYGDFSCAGRDARSAGGADLLWTTGGAGIVPAAVASLTHRRSDSVVVPIVAARRRQDAYGKGDAFFPDHQAGESSEHYLNRMGEDQRRGDAYRKGDPFMPSLSDGR